jgi:hypothetical protein
MTGKTKREVSRILSVLALLAVVATGCGSAAPTQRSADRIPRALARGWEREASAIAAAASAGDDCGALRLAKSLHDQVAASRRKLPLRLRSPLLTGVRSLVDRITCPPPPATPPKQPKPPKPHHGEKDHGHHHHHGPGGDGNDQ